MHGFVDLRVAHTTWTTLGSGAVEMVNHGDLVNGERLCDVDHPLTCFVSIDDLLPGSSWKLAVTARRRSLN